MSKSTNNNKSIEKAFQSHLNGEKKQAARMMSIIAIALYLAFAIVDLFSVSASLSEVLFIRGGVVVILVLGYLFINTELFFRFYKPAIISVFLLSTLGIEAMIYLTQPGDHAAKVYFVGLILIIMTIYTWAYIELKTSIFVISLIIGSYLYLALVIKGDSQPVIFVNIFFLLGAAIIGLASQLMRDRFIRENFLLQQSLKEALDEKTVEAKDNEYLANHDSLTGLPNRRYITTLLEQSLDAAKEQDRVAVFLFIDLNGFKKINDEYGHYAGDEVLKIVAKRLELGIRTGDNLSRLGGDEFLIGLLMGKESIKEIEAIARKFSALVEEPMNITGINIKVSCSVGIAAYPMHGDDVNVLIDIADKKMYQVKNDQRNISDNNRVVDIRQATRLR